MQADVTLYSQNNHFGGASLLACSPPKEYTTSQEQVDSLTIKSNADFDIGWQAGKNLDSLVHINYSESYEESGAYRKTSLRTYLLSNRNAPIIFELSFIKSPSIQKKHIFTIYYKQKNGEIYTYTTPEITFP
jgi:hypothetical protein